MASSSSSSNVALPRANGSKYDVFLSFRGEDTRHSFTDHLHAALTQAGILTFRDSNDAERGEELKQEIENAIKTSDASIIVLSGNYATSTWCLDELSLILDQRRDRNHFVLPVFYHVDPSHVGKQKGSFEIQADPSKRRWSDDNVERWKAALTEVVGVIGMTLVGSETKFIKEVVDTIYNRLDRKEIHIPANITGMDVRYEEINSLLKQSKAQFLVICGMAGSGKSTLAQYIVYLEGQQFESNSIVEKIGSRCKNSHDMVVLQEQLCSDISKGKQDRRIDTVCKGTAHIEVLLERTKALIVLDEIVEEQHLEELLGSGNINKESKIIITTNNDLSNWFMSKSKRFQKYTMRLLNDDEALELLSLHAFRSKLPKDGYTGLAQQVVRYCGGNPLALEVLGSSLSKNDTITSWESELSSFEKSFHDKMYEVFIRSYNSLPSSSEKELFLHCACFFVGSDMNDVVKILEPDYGAESKIKTLTRKCFLYVTPDNKLMMHRLLQDMGRSLVDRESRITSERTRVWRNKDSYDILRRKKISNTIEGLALDIEMLMKEDGFESRHLKELSTDSLQRMDQLKLLQLKFVKLTGSYEDLSEHLRWLCWVGFNETTVRTHIYMRNMVALDMSYSYLKEFEPPTYLPSLKILNLKDSHKLSEVRNFHEIPNLETLILWNCHNLLRVCRTIRNLERLALLNMAGCKNLFTAVPISTSGVEISALEMSFPLPRSLQRVFFNDCNLECTEYFPLGFSDQLFLQYINLANGHFEILPSYNLLENLRVLDLRKCSRLKRLLCLPSTLAELYIYDCKALEKITFESGRFTLQEFGYEGCIILSEIQGWVRLFLIAVLNETDLGHMIWLKEYQNHEVCLVGDHQLTNGRCCHLQMLYEFNIMSTSLPDIKHPKLTLDYMSSSTSLSFEVPSCPSSTSSIIGLNVTFRYTISGDDWVWFAKIKTTNGVDLSYSPKVFGKPASGEVGIWLSYWPIGSSLQDRDEVTVSIVVMSGLEVHECGASLVYTDVDVHDTLENETGWIETFGRDISAFQLSKGCYYLCQRDFYKLMEVGRLSPGWLSNLVGDTIDDTEVRGWSMTGRPEQLYQSFSELKTVGCIGPEMALSPEAGWLSDMDKINLEQPKEMGLIKSYKNILDLEITSSYISSTTSAQPCRRFTLPEILFATKDFDEQLVIGIGGFGKVYRGQISSEKSGHVVAIKRLESIATPAEVDFKEQIQILSTLHHPNLLPLIGYCDDYKERYLVHEYMPHGNLYDHLHNAKTPLTWVHRMKIAIGAARGLEYLHTGSGMRYGIIHGYVKSSNIYLDENWEAMISDFGLSKIVPADQSLPYAVSRIHGTIGYIDPNYFCTGRLTKKTDVYAFGIVLFELLSGRLPVDEQQSTEEVSLASWAKKCVRERKFTHMVDSNIKGTITPHSLRRFAQLADHCLLTDPIKRPTMSEVVASLQDIIELQEKNDDSAKSSGTKGISSKLKKWFGL